MEKLDRYLGATYSNICKLAIMTETASTFPDPEMPTTTDLGTECPKRDGEMIYLEKKDINEAIPQKLRKKDVYESEMHKIYNLIVGQKDKQLQEKAASDATFQAIKTDRYRLGYLMILKMICF